MQEHYTLLDIIRATGMGWNESEFPAVGNKFFETLDKWGIKYSPDVKGIAAEKLITGETLARLTADMEKTLAAIQAGQRTDLTAHAPVIEGFVRGLKKILG